MPANSNRAARLHKIFSLARKIDGSINKLDAWTSVFGFPQTLSKIDRTLMLGGVLEKLKDELSGLHRDASLSHFPSDFYDEPIRFAFNVFDTYVLSNQWEDSRRFLTERFITVLEALAHTLPSEEEALDEKELQELAKQLQSLREDIEKSDLPFEVQSFFFRQIDILERAIRYYPIGGKRAFTEAYAQMASVIATEGHVVKDHQDEQTVDFMQRLGRAWGTVRERVEDADAILKITAWAGAGVAAAHYVPQIEVAIKGLLGG